jgi:hypothetical protein
MGSLESYCESGVLLFVLDHNSSLGGTLHRPFQSGGGIVYFVGNHFQRHGYIVEQRCDAVSGGCLYLPPASPIWNVSGKGQWLALGDQAALYGFSVGDICLIVGLLLSVLWKVFGQLRYERTAQQSTPITR